MKTSKKKLLSNQKLWEKEVHCNLLIQNSMEFIENMLFKNKVRIKDVPFSLRTYKTSLYICALRISRGISQERYMQDLNLLKSNIQNIHNYKKRNFIELYKNSMNFCPNALIGKGMCFFNKST